MYYNCFRGKRQIACHSSFRRLASLVPEYLSAVPQDPYGDGPLIYRRTGDSYLIYSVGGNGTDDGGQHASLNEALDSEKPNGDLFFDAKWDTP